jgi:hypothetical protein
MADGMAGGIPEGTPAPRRCAVPRAQVRAGHARLVLEAQGDDERAAARLQEVRHAAAVRGEGHPHGESAIQ